MPLLETERDSAKLFALASSLAKGDVSLEVVSWVRMGRITALRKEDGGVRGITVGDILRRLVARTIAQQISKVVEESTAPCQYALCPRRWDASVWPTSSRHSQTVTVRHGRECGRHWGV